MSNREADTMTAQRFEIIVTRYEQETATNDHGPYLTGRELVSSVETTECADRAELLRELNAHGAGPAERTATDGFVVTHTRYRREWRVVPAEAPAETVEYALVEVDGDVQRPLPHCGSWYTDRYYTNDLTGRDAAVAAAARVAEHAGGQYAVVEVRRFARAAA
jgi:hypothetical protein